MNEKLKLIREKCIGANPEIVELKFECEVETKEWNEYDAGRRFIVAETGMCSRHKKYREECYEDSNCDVQDGFAVIRISEEEGCWYEEFKTSEIKSLGRPIRLADVLLAIDGISTNPMMKIGISGSMWGWDDVGGFNHIPDASWNLRTDDLEQQSEETITFLYEIFKS